MNYMKLNDLDELILRVRDPKAKSYIIEAVDAYRGGAYRAAIISTWITVTFDIISKIRELASQDDALAKERVTELDETISAKDIKKLQKIEGNLLKDAHDNFEFLSSQEYLDLSLLKDDRNLCAHPAFIAEESLFEPEPERVRMHIVHAVRHLLQHQPVQGKSALKRLMADIKSITFPSELEAVSVFLNAKYLDRSKESLIQNSISVLVKALLGKGKDNPAPPASKILLALQAIAKRHINVYEKRMKEILPKIIETLEDSIFPEIFQLISIDERCWQWVGESSQIRLKTLTERVLHGEQIKTGTKTVMILKGAAKVTELKSLILNKFDSLEQASKVDVIRSIPIIDFVGESIKIFSESSTFRDAESHGYRVIIPMIQHFSASDVVKILEAVKKNGQIYNAYEMQRILEIFFDETIQYFPATQNAWKELAESFKNWTWLVNKLEERGISISQSS